MKIALINENSQAAKNALIEATLRKVVEPMGHEVVNYGMYAADDAVGHEARIGRISDDAVFYLMSRGIPEEEARAMIVSGFADNVSKELPLEYAMEMNNLIRLEMKGSIG